MGQSSAQLPEESATDLMAGWTPVEKPYIWQFIGFYYGTEPTLWKCLLITNEQARLLQRAWDEAVAEAATAPGVEPAKLRDAAAALFGPKRNAVLTPEQIEMRKALSLYCQQVNEALSNIPANEKAAARVAAFTDGLMGVVPSESYNAWLGK